jgi:SnoaL-like domain
MTDATKIANGYIDVWNEKNPARRRVLLVEGWSDAATYVDPMMTGKGHEQIAAMIGAVQDRFPGFKFALDGRVDGYGDHVRFSWKLGPPGESDMIKGTDFVVLEAGRLKSVTGFLDKVPAGAGA